MRAYLEFIEAVTVDERPDLSTPEQSYCAGTSYRRHFHCKVVQRGVQLCIEARFHIRPHHSDAVSSDAVSWVSELLHPRFGVFSFRW